MTENSHALIADVYQRIVAYKAGTRKRERRGKAAAFVHALEGFVGDLLGALERKEYAAAWVYRPVTQRSFTKEAVSFRDFDNARKALLGLGLLEEAPAVQFWGFDKQVVTKRFATRFRATAQLQELATAHGVSPCDASDHFIQGPPEHPLVLKAPRS